MDFSDLITGYFLFGVRGAITKEEKVSLYGDLNKANQAYQQVYGLKY